MTLLEVVIVLALLAGLAGMTLTAMSDLDDDHRVERTRDRLETMREAVLGDGADAGSFLADLGRAPVLQDNGEGRTLTEFFESPDDSVFGQTVTYAIPIDLFGETLTGLPGSVATRAGWNGPYLLTAGEQSYDGFGRDWRVRLADDPATWRLPSDLGAAELGETILGVTSLGRDDAAGGTTWADRDASIDLDVPRATASLSVTILLRDNTQAGRSTWMPVGSTDPWSVYPTWAGAGAYALDDIVRASDGSAIFRCSSAGSSGSSEPSWAKDQIGDETSDGGVTWTLVANRRAYADRVRAALFVPYTPTRPDAGSGVELVALVARRSGDTTDAYVAPDRGADMAPMPSTWSGRSNVTWDGLAPGSRKLLVCAWVDDGGTVTGGWRSVLLDVDVRPGGNVVEAYLTEPVQ